MENGRRCPRSGGGPPVRRAQDTPAIRQRSASDARERAKPESRHGLALSQVRACRAVTWPMRTSRASPKIPRQPTAPPWADGPTTRVAESRSSHVACRRAPLPSACAPQRSRRRPQHHWTRGSAGRRSMIALKQRLSASPSASSGAMPGAAFYLDDSRDCGIERCKPTAHASDRSIELGRLTGYRAADAATGAITSATRPTIPQAPPPRLSDVRDAVLSPARSCQLGTATEQNQRAPTAVNAATPSTINPTPPNCRPVSRSWKSTYAPTVARAANCDATTAVMARP